MADPSWWRRERKSARKLRAMAVIDHARRRQVIDHARHRELQQAIPRTPHTDVPELVGGLPVPRWDRVPPADAVDHVERDFAMALLNVAHQAEVLSAPERKWRLVFASNARTAGDLLVLFLGFEPHLSSRRTDPELAARLDRLAFVPKIFEARSRGALSRPQLEDLLKRTASGEDLETLRVELGVPAPPPVLRARPAAARPAPPASKAATAKKTRAAEAAPADRPVTDVDRARIAKHLGTALADERLTPGEHAIRTVALWSATTTHDLARLIVDLPAPASEPLRDRKPDAYLDDLITPTHRQVAVDRLHRMMAGHALTLWEFEARLEVALKARTFEELGPAARDLPPG
ncbi:DUF1707 domain-containing protein [Lentzea sp. NPDC005914]|uniref:DUF1707 SHOCT-like domain-containing protein n=1 Tax=Lentzea sp. NPDC005914 TaxID=3154572 RepID=UPI0033D092E6